MWHWRRIGVLAGIAGISLTTSAQVPPPPIPPNQGGISKTLTESLETADLNIYSNLLSKDLKVYKNNQLVSSSKVRWIQDFGKLLKTEGVKIHVQQSYESYSRILEVQRVETYGSWAGGGNSHCCQYYEAVAYDVSNNQIEKISILSSGNIPG